MSVRIRIGIQSSIPPLVIVVFLTITQIRSSPVIHLQNDNNSLNKYKYELVEPMSNRFTNLWSVLNLSTISSETFVSPKTSLKCGNHTRLLYDDVIQMRPWALEMFDASAKIPSQILKGNLNWWGSYSECINVQVPYDSGNELIGTNKEDQLFKGQYCSVTLRLNTSITTEEDETSIAIKNFLNLVNQEIVHKKYEFPDFVIDLCVPSSCNRQDVKLNIENAFRYMLPSKSIEVLAHVQTCQTKDTIKLDSSALTVIIIWGVFALVIIIATILEIAKETIEKHSLSNKYLLESQVNVVASTSDLERQNAEREERSPSITALSILLCFSALTNVRQLLNVGPRRRKTRSDNLSVLNGIRFLSISWIVLLHTHSEGVSLDNLWINNNEIVDLSRHIFFQLVYKGVLGVDSFLFMSGLLLVFTGIRKVEQSKNCLRCFISMFIHRLIRIAPAYYMTIAWTTGPSDYVFRGGPPWSKMELRKHYCQQTWWKSLLYISNFFETSKMCAVHTWYISLDMQLFIVGCILLIIVQRQRKIGLILIAICGIGSCVITGIISYVGNLPALLQHGYTTPELTTAFFKDFYIKPYCRMGPYAVGMLIGYFLRCGSGEQLKKHMKPIVAYYLWLLAVVVCLSVAFGTYDKFFSGDDTDALSDAFYNALAGTVWSLSIAWIVCASYIGYGGFVESILSFKALVPLGQLTYTTYLTHFTLVSAFFLSRIDTKLRYDLFFGVILFFGLLMLCYCVAFLFSMAFEAPFANLEQLHRSMKQKKKSMGFTNS